MKVSKHSWCFLLLQAAGNAVKKASDNLVKAAQKAAFDAQDDQAVMVKSKMVGGIAQVRQRVCNTCLSWAGILVINDMHMRIWV